VGCSGRVDWRHVVAVRRVAVRQVLVAALIIRVNRLGGLVYHMSQQFAAWLSSLTDQDLTRVDVRDQGEDRRQMRVVAAILRGTTAAVVRRVGGLHTVLHLEYARAVVRLVMVRVGRLEVHVGVMGRAGLVLDGVVFFSEHLALERALHVGSVRSVPLDQTLQVLRNLKLVANRGQTSHLLHPFVLLVLLTEISFVERRQQLVVSGPR
jgi:hypothetical protein